MQFQADVLGVPVVVPEIAETTALGRRLPRRRSRVGKWTSRPSRDMWRERRRYEPRMSADERESLLERWHEAVERSRGWARD